MTPFTLGKRQTRYLSIDKKRTLCDYSEANAKASRITIVKHLKNLKNIYNK